MQANLSLMMNVIFLIIILAMMVWRLRPYLSARKNPSTSTMDVQNTSTIQDADRLDEVMPVRKVEMTRVLPESAPKPVLGVAVAAEHSEIKKNIMIFIAAKGQSIFAGYDLLQTLLAAGLRYGDAGLFHRHQHATGQGPVLFSLAAATATGVFDMQNIGAMSVKGLCMFMELSGNITIDGERFQIFMQTAKQLAQDLKANLLDDRQFPLTDETIHKFEHMIAETFDLTHY